MNDKYIIETNRIICISGSGNEYYITKSACTCKGFGFRRSCRHYEHSKEMGLLEKLEENKLSSITNSPFIINHRKLALIAFCEKHFLKFTNELINKIEPKINRNMNSEGLKLLVKDFYENFC